jgi:hypothetical protein
MLIASLIAIQKSRRAPRRPPLASRCLPASSPRGLQLTPDHHCLQGPSTPTPPDTNGPTTSPPPAPTSRYGGHQGMQAHENARVQIERKRV